MQYSGFQNIHMDFHSLRYLTIRQQNLRQSGVEWSYQQFPIPQTIWPRISTVSLSSYQRLKTQSAYFNPIGPIPDSATIYIHRFSISATTCAQLKFSVSSPLNIQKSFIFQSLLEFLGFKWQGVVRRLDPERPRRPNRGAARRASNFRWVESPDF